jgi:hypothetical protein
MVNHPPLSYTVGRIARQMRKQIEPFARLYEELTRATQALKKFAILEMKRGPAIGRKRRSRRARGRARERNKS